MGSASVYFMSSSRVSLKKRIKNVQCFLFSLSLSHYLLFFSIFFCKLNQYKLIYIPVYILYIYIYIYLYSIQDDVASKFSDCKNKYFDRVRFKKEKKKQANFLEPIFAGGEIEQRRNTARGHIHTHKIFQGLLTWVDEVSIHPHFVSLELTPQQENTNFKQ